MLLWLEDQLNIWYICRCNPRISKSILKSVLSALVRTYCFDTTVADSACSATSYLCGVEHNNILWWKIKMKIRCSKKVKGEGKLWDSWGERRGGAWRLRCPAGAFDPTSYLQGWIQVGSYLANSRWEGCAQSCLQPPICLFCSPSHEMISDSPTLC